MEPLVAVWHAGCWHSSLRHSMLSSQPADKSSQSHIRNHARNGSAFGESNKEVFLIQISSLILFKVQHCNDCVGTTRSSSLELPHFSATSEAESTVRQVFIRWQQHLKKLHFFVPYCWFHNLPLPQLCQGRSLLPVIWFTNNLLKDQSLPSLFNFGKKNKRGKG